MSNKMRTDYIERNISPGNMVRVEVKVHPGTNKKIIVINYPGYAGDIDGFNHKYAKLADHTAMKIGSTLRIAGADWIRGEHIEDTVAKQLDATIQFAIQNSQAIAGVDEKDLEINLMGFSAGASGIAVVSSKYPQVKKVLLMAPSGDAGEEQVKNGLGEYKGEFYGVVGENDEVVGSGALGIFSKMARVATKTQTLIIPNCDHQFRGTENGIIMSASPIWAFQKGGEGAIDKNDGIKLY